MKKTIQFTMLLLLAAGTVQRTTPLIRAAHALPPAQHINANVLQGAVYYPIMVNDPPPPTTTPKDTVCCKCIGLQCIIDK